MFLQSAALVKCVSWTVQVSGQRFPSIHCCAHHGLGPPRSCQPPAALRPMHLGLLCAPALPCVPCLQELDVQICQDTRGQPVAAHQQHIALHTGQERELNVVCLRELTAAQQRRDGAEGRLV